MHDAKGINARTRSPRLRLMGIKAIRIESEWWDMIV